MSIVFLTIGNKLDAIMSTEILNTDPNKYKRASWISVDGLGPASLNLNDFSTHYER